MNLSFFFIKIISLVYLANEDSLISFTLANDPGASLQGYTWKKLYYEHGDVFFVLCPWPRPGLYGMSW